MKTSPEITLISFIQTNLPGYEQEEFQLPFEIQHVIFKSGNIITAYNHIEDKILFLEEGIVQISTMQQDEERILEFVFPGRFFGSYTSFLQQQPSYVELLALKECTASVIRRQDLLRSNKTSLLSSHLSQYIAEQLFLSRAKRERDLLVKTGEERYRDLLKERPELMKDIPLNRIAKYLGLHPESLSRIRKSIFS